MKKTILTAAVMALLMGGFCFSASANVMPAENTTEVFAGDKWDKLLDEYEKYVNQYIAAYNKLKKGDATAASDCAKLAEKIEKVVDKLEDAEDEMSDAQLKRFAKITENMAKAAM